MTEHHDHSEGEPRDTVVSGTEIEEEGDACDDPCELFPGRKLKKKGTRVVTHSGDLFVGLF